MNHIDASIIKQLKLPEIGSHKGQNGRLLIIGGSRLFHAASLWALTVASRFVDLVHYASVPENNEIVQKSKEEFRNGIVIRREDIEEYIEEDDVILIGPGMVRAESPVHRSPFIVDSLEEVQKIQNEGKQTEALTNYLLAKYPKKKWVIDAGALQMIDVNLIPKFAILTPHHKEMEGLINKQISNTQISNVEIESVEKYAQKYKCIVLCKGHEDIVCNPVECRIITGGNPGMTKGGTGDVLAGLVAGLACTNEQWIAAIAASIINKAAGDDLYRDVGPFFNATDLANQIPKTVKHLLEER